MKVLVTTDWHLDAVTAGIERLAEFPGYLEALLRAATEEVVDLVLFLGDAFDPGAMTGPRHTSVLIDAALRLHAAARLGSVWVAGNHDVVETSEGYTTLSPLATCSRLVPGLHVAEVPTTILWADPDRGKLAILALPYTARAVEMRQGFAGVWAAAFEQAAQLSGDGVPLVVAGHMTVPGAVLGSETREMSRGRDVDFPFDEVAELNPTLVLAGHYHKAQTVRGPGGVEVLIPGSPHRFTFGEREDAEKGFLLLEVS